VNALSMLDRKLVRDLARLWAQALAVALVMACGVMTLILALGATRALDETRSAFYDRTRFGDIFAAVTRAPDSVKSAILAIDGVSAVATRIVNPVIIDITGMDEPASGMLISIPDYGEPAVNRLYLRSGRMPEPGRSDEAAIIESFALAHGFRPGDHFDVLINGRKLTLSITGITLSPEHVYAIGPGDMVPDQRRYGVIHMRRGAIEGAYDMVGAFNDVSLTLSRAADKKEVIARLDSILEAAMAAPAPMTARTTCPTRFLTPNWTQLKAMAQVIPPIFLFIAAVPGQHDHDSRLIALEREQIGLLKAVGYTNTAIAWHYAKLTLGDLACRGDNRRHSRDTARDTEWHHFMANSTHSRSWCFHRSPIFMSSHTLITFRSGACAGATNAIIRRRTIAAGSGHASTGADQAIAVCSAVPDRRVSGCCSRNSQ
jgi:putative ABC transport system permease protein